MLDTKKYGGFSSVKPSYGAVVRHTNDKGKEIVTLESIPVLYRNNSKQYIESIYGSSFEILKNPVLFNQLFELDGGLYRLSSTSEWSNSVELMLTHQNELILKKVLDNRTEVTTKEKVQLIEAFILKIDDHYPLISKKRIDELRALIEVIDSVSDEDYLQLMRSLLAGMSSGKSVGSFAIKDLINLKSFGRINMKNMKPLEVTFYNESITGVYTRKFKLK